MKVAFLMATGDAVGGTEIVTRAYAARLAHTDDVTLVSVYRTTATGMSVSGVRTIELIDVSRGRPVPLVDCDVEPEDAYALSTAPSDVVLESWDSQFSQLSDIALESVLRNLRSDVLVTTSPALLALALRYRREGAQVFHHEHRASEFRLASLPPLLRYGPASNGVAFLTDASRRAFSEEWGPGAPPLHVLPNPVSDAFRPRATLQDKAVIMAVRLVPEKQVEHAVLAFHDATQGLSTWQLRIFGSGPARRRIRRLIQAMHLEDRVLLLGSTHNMHLEWARGSVALLTSKFEGFSLALAEAQTAGLPIVSYDSPNGPKEIVRNGIDGALVPLDDRDGLASALRRYMQDTELRQAAGQAAFEGSSRFALDLATARLRKAFQDAEADVSRSRHRVAVARAVAGGDGSGSAQEPVLSVLQMPGGWQPIQVRDGNADLVAHLLDSARVRFYVARSSSWSESRIVLSAADRARVTDLLLTTAAGRLISDQEQPHVQRFFTPHEVGGNNWVLGEEYACRIDYWEPEVGGGLAWPQSNPLKTIRPGGEPTARVKHGNDYRTTVATLVEPETDAVLSPIDIVYTWVDGGDTSWRARRDEFSGRGGSSAEADERFRQQDELRFSLRSVASFAPWVRHIWIVTDRQRPRWLRMDHPDVTVVDHREIAPFPVSLPVFNSHAIEAWLHRIPGLTDSFLYLNDDVFFGRPVSPEQFFAPGGLCRVFPSPTTIPSDHDPDAGLVHFAAARNGVRLLAEHFGRTHRTTFLHTPHALSRKTLAEISDEFPNEWRRTATSRWRSGSDLSLASFFHHAYSLMNGRAVIGEVNSAFVNPSRFDHLPRLAGLNRRERDVFCINDFGDGEIDYAGRHRLVDSFLRAYFPLRSHYEGEDSTSA